MDNEYERVNDEDDEDLFYHKKMSRFNETISNM